MAKFKEYTPFQGVDESAPPTGIIVPMGPGPGKFNLVRLAGGQGIRPQPPPSAPTIKIEDVTEAGNFLGAAALHSPLLPGDKLFKISGSLPLTTQVQAGGDTLQIAVVKQRTVKLAIRPVQVRDPQNPNALVNHSKVPIGDIDAMVDQMNAIWTPQANVVFTLVPSTPVQLTDETRIGNIAGQSLGAAFQTPSPLPVEVNIDVFRDYLFDNRDPNAHLTMFLVQGCARGSQTAPDRGDNGVSQWLPGAAWGISLISDARAQSPALMAHEAGHFLGDLRRHTDDTTQDEKGNYVVLDKRKQLMIRGGGTFAYSEMGSILIPYDLVINRFNKPLKP